MAARLSASLVQCFVIVGALAATRLFGSDSLVRLTTSNFDLYSDLNRKQAAALLKQLEDTRRALDTSQLLPSHNSDERGDSPLRVIAFRSDREFARYRSNDAASAYYLRANGREYIVLGADFSDAGRPIVHEYVHHLLHRRYRHLPLWLDEGLAEVYSTVREDQQRLRIGLPPEDRLDWLRMDGFAYDLPTLFSIRPTWFDNVKHLTPRTRFYAESWLLVHMLRFAPGYAGQFPAFLEDVEHGARVEAALQDRFGKTPAMVYEDLTRYLHSERMPTELLPNSGSAATPPVSGSSLSETQWDAVLSELRSALDQPGQASAAWSRSSSVDQQK
jgi:hypothetical protein